VPAQVLRAAAAASEENAMAGAVHPACTSTRRGRPATSCCSRCGMGKVRMVASEFETVMPVIKNRGPTSRAAAAAVEQDSFVLLQMAPDMWYLELSNISNSSIVLV